MLNEKDNLHKKMLYNNNNYFWISIISFLLLLYLVNSNNNITAFGRQSNLQSENENINIVVAGDFYCNDQTEDTIENIISVNPEL